MVRRKSYSKVIKSNRINGVAKGKGDIPYRVFNCLNPSCDNMIYLEEVEIFGDFNFPCPKCGYNFSSDGEQKIYDYEMKVDDAIIETGEFTIFHAQYIEESPKYKYCILCNTLKPVEYFDAHASRKTGRQGECRACKKIYNSIKNQTRTTDQHREAAQKRRLYVDITGKVKIDSKKIYERFKYECFNCHADLKNDTKHLDHTLPAYYLYPLTTENATLLCQTCNGNKSNKWPNIFYSDNQLRELSVITGIPYDVLKGEPTYNINALLNLKKEENIDSLLTKYSKYLEKEIIPLRNRLLKETKVDIFENATKLSQVYIDEANSKL